MGLYGYIGLAIVVGLLVGLVTLSVVWTVKTVGKGLRDRSISLLSTYDALLEERSRQLSWINTELQRREDALREAEAEKTPVEQTVQAVPNRDFLRTAERITTTSYQDSGVGEMYRKIKQNFAFTPQEALAGIPARKDRPRGRGPATKLLEQLSFDTIFQLSTLSGEEQLALLRKTLPADAQETLEEYASSVSLFDSVGFYDHLKSKAMTEPGPICLRVSAKCAQPISSEDVKIIVDEDICEGVQVEVDNVLYDYCVKMREIG